MIDYQYIRHYDYSGMRTAPLCIDGHTKGNLRFESAFLELGRQAVSDADADVGTRSGSTDVVGQHLAVLEVVGHAVVDETANSDEVVVVVLATEVIHHHLNGVDGSDGVDLVLTGVLGSGAVNGFEERMVVADVARGRHAHAALKDRAEVGGNVTKHVGGHDGVVVLG